MVVNTQKDGSGTIPEPSFKCLIFNNHFLFEDLL